MISAYVPATTSFERIFEVTGEIARDPELSVFNDVTIFEDLNSLIPKEAPYDSVKALAAELYRQNGAGGDCRSAYVVSSSVDFGLVRVYVTYRDRTPGTTKSFINDLDGALSFVGITPSELPRYRQLVDELAREARGER
ncbi:MAG: hypothetical protein U5O39_12235 [Gammaproteobacteria bacterium]|nr:hypothetical protein [Gammaproteobacteria bacterium]